MSCRQLEGKNAIVTGGAQGLGEAIVHRLASEGANVVIADINLANCEKVAADVAAKYGIKSIPLKVDVTNDEDAEAMVKACTGNFGTLDIMVCNAAILISGDTTEFATADWRKVIEVNLVGGFICAREAARRCSPRRRDLSYRSTPSLAKEGAARTLPTPQASSAA
jgi:sorbitol-6-phosphate 2-dehydrogenase